MPPVYSPPLTLHGVRHVRQQDEAVKERLLSQMR